jgi:hemerythrin-like domain-containing protein
MYAIEILVKEHENIKKFTDQMERICINIMDGSELNTEIFRKAIVFIREYADGHHHGKEEKILFQYMIDNLGSVANTLVRNGMLVEHDLARLNVLEMENAINRYEESHSTKDRLDIISNMMGYVYLLRRHIDKEDGVVYPYAENNLSKVLLNEVDAKSREIEDGVLERDDYAEHLRFLESLIEM